MRVQTRSRRYGSIRILRDGRVRFSAWSLPGLSYISFTTMGGDINVVRGNRPVLYLSLERNRVTSSCFPYDLTPDELRTVIEELRRAGHGLERWIVPGLEENQASGTVKRDHPEKHALLPELLESCRDLPVAEHWRKIRANVKANASEDTPAQTDRKATTAGRTKKVGGKSKASKAPRGKPPRRTG